MPLKTYFQVDIINNDFTAPKVIKQSTDWTKKKEFGKTPEYLNKIKESIGSEYNMIQNLHLSEADEL